MIKKLQRIVQHSFYYCGFSNVSNNNR